MRCALTAAALALLAGCPEAVSPEPLGDYTAWPMMGGTTFTVRGQVPGHGDTVRVIYANATAVGASSISPSYPLGSVIVKEIRENDNGQPGALRYTAIMRRDREVETGLEAEGGWLFTDLRPDSPQENYFGLCWARCHVAAPYNGAFYDYRRAP